MEAAPPRVEGVVRRTAAITLTLLLLAPAAALLLARLRALTTLQTAGAAGCSGLDTLGPVLHAGLPAVALVIIVPIALLSLSARARGWIWLALALVGTVLLDMALQVTIPACL